MKALEPALARLRRENYHRPILDFCYNIQGEPAVNIAMPVTLHLTDVVYPARKAERQPRAGRRLAIPPHRAFESTTEP
jgi:hypothetical protein